MSAPRVSVIISCFNLGAYLDEAVDSVLGQSFDDYEILIVDDASTDPETRTLLAGYTRPRTRVLVLDENRGLPAVKNLGLAHTTGSYVCMLDADDRLTPDMLEHSVTALDGDPSCAFVSHWVRWFGDETGDWTPTDCGFPALLDRNTVNGAALTRRSVLDASGGFDESFRSGCEDWDLWITLVEQGFTGRILPEVLYWYRRRAGSMSREMVRGDGHPLLYRRIADKHRESFRAYLPALLARREEDIATMRGHVHDMELDQHRWLGPEVARAAEDVAVLERHARQQQDQQRREQEIAGLASALEQARAAEVDAAATIAALRSERAHFEAALDHSRGEAADAHRQVEAFRASLSWRATAPLRVLYDWLRSIWN